MSGEDESSCRDSNGCCEKIRSELHYSRAGLRCEEPWKSFYYCPWFPRNLKWQLLYLLYRWLLALYFLCWFLVIILNAANGIKWKFLIYISNWAFLVWVAYLVISAISLSINFSLQLQHRCRQRAGGVTEGEGKGHNIDDCSCSKCQGRRHHTVRTCSLMEKVQWVLFTVGAEFAVAITLLYWTLFYTPQSKHNFFSLDSLHVHLINGVLAMVDLWFTGVPVRVYHTIYPVLFAVNYVAFTGVYYAAGGTDPMGNSYIYPFLNYHTNPGAAAGLGIVCALILTTAIHLVFFLQFSLRNLITSNVQRRCYGRTVLCRKGLFITYNHLQNDCACAEIAL